MSFTFGAFDSDGLDLIATLRELPSLGGLQLETLEAVGADGVTLGGTTRRSVRFTFDVILNGATVVDALGKADAVAAALDPARGEQDLGIDALPGWRWSSILAAPIAWGRLTWDAGAGFQLRAEVAFDALEAYGRPLVDDEWELTGPGSLTVARSKGNARSFPAVELLGSLSAAQTATVTIGDVVVVVQGPLTSGQVLRLDWDQFDFARWSGSTKVASAVGVMSTLDRPELWPNTSTTFAVATTGSITSARLRANSRRQ